LKRAVIRAHALTTGTPSFGCVITSSTSCDYVAFDAEAPSTLDTIATESEPLFGASFIADDFSKQYVIAYPSGNLKTVDTASGAITDIGATGYGTQMRDIAYDPTTDTLFGGAINGFGTDLFTIDRTTGATKSIGTITGLGSPSFVMGMAVEPYTGLMYGIEIASSSLVAIDKTTGTASVIGPLGYTTRYSQGLGFNPKTGILYLTSIDIDSSSQNLYEVDIQTGHASLVDRIGNDIVQLGAFGVAEPAGSCSRPSDQSWLSLGPVAGVTPPSDSVPVIASIDTTDMHAGDVLSGVICAASNDPNRRMVTIPIAITVTP
jgi:DNA-binding beta-propeller fold protein YncE